MVESKPLNRRKTAFPMIESIETRRLMSISLDSAGWTVVTPDPGARIVYVSSSSGNDHNSGLSASSPVQSIGKGMSLLQNHSGDELLLKAGDTFNDRFASWSLSGNSASDPIVISTYGAGARPVINSGYYAALFTSKTPVSNLAIIGLSFNANLHASNPAKDPTGVDLMGGGSNYLIENCEFQNYDVNINAQAYWGPLSNVTLRRNIVLNAWSINTHAEGFYALGVNGITLTGNDFDHDGWDTSIPYAYATVFNHDVYISAKNSNVSVTNNIFAEASATGLQDRAGGTVTNNLFINDPVGMTFGLVNGAETQAGGVSGIVENNVFIGGAKTGNYNEGIGLEVGNINRNGVIVSNNVFANEVNPHGPAIELAYGSGVSNASQAVGLNNVTVENNIMYSTGGVVLDGGLTPGGNGPQALNNVKILNNQFSNMILSVELYSSYYSQVQFSGNEYYNANLWLANLNHAPVKGTVESSPFAYPAPNRSAATYDATIGGNGTLSDFLGRAANQSEANWNTDLTAAVVANYISLGF